MIAARNLGFKKVSLFFVFAVFLGFIGCSNANAPSENQGKEGMNQWVEKNIGKYVTLKSFKKTDGQASELGGIKGYRMAFQLELEAKRDFHYQTLKSFSFRDSFTELPPRDIPGGVIAGGSVAKKKGDIVSINGNINLEKTEKGWQTKRVEFENKYNY